jgi:hypothetical protein
MTATLSTPVDSRPRWKRLRPPVLLAAGLLGASVLLHLRDPHQSGSWGYCPWLMLTGTYCPGCGGLRAVNDLTNGEVAGAASSNLLFIASLPLIAALWGRSVVDRWRGERRRLDPQKALTYSLVFLGLALLFGIVRNLSFGAWLAP